MKVIFCLGTRGRVLDPWSRWGWSYLPQHGGKLELHAEHPEESSFTLSSLLFGSATAIARLVLSSVLLGKSSGAEGLSSGVVGRCSNGRAYEEERLYLLWKKHFLQKLLDDTILVPFELGVYSILGPILWNRSAFQRKQAQQGFGNYQMWGMDGRNAWFGPKKERTWKQVIVVFTSRTAVCCKTRGRVGTKG